MGVGVFVGASALACGNAYAPAAAVSRTLRHG